MLIVWMPIFIIYSIISFLLVAWVLKAISKKAASITAIVLLLIPTWDVVIALLIYIPASLFWSGDTILKQVTTDTIHYDKFYRKYGPVKSRPKLIFYNKNKYAEMEVTEINKKYSFIKEKGFYRFWIDDTNELQFKKIDKIEARYTVKFLKSREIDNIPIKFSTIQVIDRKTKEIIAWGNNAIVYYDNVGIFPFFNWIHWKEVAHRIQSNSDWQRLERETINP